MPVQKITVDDLQALITKTEYTRLEGTTKTFCHIFIGENFSITGESACLNPADFDEATGREYAYKDAFSKLWQLEGYHRARCAVNELQIIGYAVKLTRDDASQSYEVSCRDLPELHAVLHDDLCRDDLERHQEIADAIETCAMLYADSGRGMPLPTPALDGEIVVHVPIPKSGGLSPFAAMKTEIQ